MTSKPKASDTKESDQKSQDPKNSSSVKYKGYAHCLLRLQVDFTTTSCGQQGTLP